MHRWTGRETRALRHALRMSIRDFAERLGVAERTVSKWEAGQTAISPRPEIQAALDTTLDQSDNQTHSRFNSMLSRLDLINDPSTDSGSGRDLAILSRQQIAMARETLGFTLAEFAEALAVHLGWKPTEASLNAWESTTTPPGDVLIAASLASRGSSSTFSDLLPNSTHLADLRAAYTNRAELTTHMPPESLLDGARDVRAMGLSLNLLCQHYPDRHWDELLRTGTNVRCLFADPDGDAIRAREIEEEFPAGHLSSLTKLNIETMSRIRDRLPTDSTGTLTIATYDQTIRFNIILIDDVCVSQAYLPQGRGIDSPTLVTENRSTTGLYPIFDQIFDAHWEQRRQL
ncbi:DUF5919 domain-containing protein [Micromonospora sp. NPDC003197]